MKNKLIEKWIKTIESKKLIEESPILNSENLTKIEDDLKEIRANCLYQLFENIVNRFPYGMNDEKFDWDDEIWNQMDKKLPEIKDETEYQFSNILKWNDFFQNAFKNIKKVNWNPEFEYIISLVDFQKYDEKVLTVGISGNNDMTAISDEDYVELTKEEILEIANQLFDCQDVTNISLITDRIGDSMETRVSITLS